jgi:hypothetical protein
MKLKTNEIEFELGVVGYQFLTMKKDVYDSNWLRILVTVKHPEACWTTIDASLLTYELKALGEWLRKVAEEDLRERCIAFMEPNLAFGVLPATGKPETLRITLSHETAPPFMLGEERSDGFAIDFPLAEIDLKAASDAILKQAKAFPERAGR